MTAAPPTVIREATLADVPRLVEMGTHFLASSTYGQCYSTNPTQMVTTITNLITSPDACGLVAEVGGLVVGMIGVVVGSHPLTGDRLAVEMCWWVEPTARGVGMRLLRAAERWAVAHGATGMQLGAPTQEVAQFYERLGCVLVERVYYRRLGPERSSC